MPYVLSRGPTWFNGNKKNRDEERREKGRRSRGGAMRKKRKHAERNGFPGEDYL